jgi:3-phenylpropionate/trans-cinnamate dioxygenase ferredoxin subunit
MSTVPEAEFARACAVADVPDQGTFAVEINGTPLVIVRSEGEVYALDEFCTHEDVSLADGEVYDQTIECWLHGSCFDLCTGKPTGPPATKALTTYPVRIDGDDVLVALPSA